MDASTIVPWLALGVASLSLTWQIIESRRRRTTRVEVEIQHAALPASVDPGAVLDFPGLGNDDRTVIWPGTNEPLTYALVLAAVNRGESTEWLHDMRLYDVSRTTGAGANAGPAVELPSRGRWPWGFRLDRSSFDLADGFYVEVVLASGSITTGPHHLDAELRAEIASHNAGVPQSGDAEP